MPSGLTCTNRAQILQKESAKIAIARGETNTVSPVAKGKLRTNARINDKEECTFLTLTKPDECPMLAPNHQTVAPLMRMTKYTRIKWHVDIDLTAVTEPAMRPTETNMMKISK
jgi:hypothetical protein